MQDPPEQHRTEPGAPEREPVASRGYANYVLGVLFLVYVFNFIDRQILSILLEPIKREIELTDTQLGFLGGIAFALFYTFAGIPIAHWADRGSRRTIIALGLFVWSAMTVLTGRAHAFSTLILARIGVGVGEAAGSPPSHARAPPTETDIFLTWGVTFFNRCCRFF